MASLEIRHDVDVFFRIEDVFYNRLVGKAGRGVVLHAETVESSNGDVRFRRSPDQHPSTEDERFRLRLAEVLIGRRLAALAPAGGFSEPVELAAARKAQQAGDAREVERLCRRLVREHEGHAEGWLATPSTSRGAMPTPSRPSPGS